MKSVELTEEQKAKKQRLGEVKKSNDLIRKAKYDLNIFGLKTIAYIFSMVKQDDPSGTFYQFEIVDYCKYLGINYESGKNYKSIRDELKHLRDTSFIVTHENGDDETVGWLDKVRTNKQKGTVAVRLDDTIEKYVKNLDSNYTKIDLISTLPMTSKYSFRIYELLRSYVYQNKTKYVFDLDELKKSLGCENFYPNYKDFRHKVLEIAIEEINTYTPYDVTVEPVFKRRKVVSLIFYVKEKKDTLDIIDVVNARRKKLDKKVLSKADTDTMKGQLKFDEEGTITEE